MIHFKTKYKKYDWDIEVYIVIKNVDVDAIQKSLEQMDCPLHIMHKSFRLLTRGINSGFTYTSPDLHKSILVVNVSSSVDEYINTFNHEKNHVEMHICEKYKIDPYSEEAAYLSGELASLLTIPMTSGLLAELF
jgi:hypothetical protein